jgi:hypothetical protein
MEKTYLAVPFDNKDDAKKLGAKWDRDNKKWFTYDDNPYKSTLINTWKLNDSPVNLFGEDRNFGGNRLYVDLIPRDCWYSNARKLIHPSDWDRVRHHVYERVNYKCECCNIDTKIDKTNGYLEAHERWKFDNITYTQKLVRLVALCHECHQSTHMGLASILGFRKEAETHLKKIRKFNDTECEDHIAYAFKLWSERNNHKWVLDITLITSNGIKIQEITKN